MGKPDEAAQPATLPSKANDFSAWYNELVEKAQLIDKRYPVKGMDVWRPYGLSVMNLLDGLIHAEMRRTRHEEVRFPTVVPETEFQKEADQIKGFGANVYWVTRGGDSELDVKLLLRPTSETAMYPMFSLWVRSHADLPLKLYQIVSVFRYETKQTRSFIRVREIHFFEAHTAHATFEDAERQILEDLEIWQRLAEQLCLPTVLTRRPDWDKFPGARYSVGADAMMPELKTLQVATMHQYGENFARPYDIQYEQPDGSRAYCHQTTYGMSERLLGAIVGIHGDDHGLVLPPPVAPIQAVVVPILFKGKEGPVLDACRKAMQDLEAAGVRAHLDDRDVTAGSKYYDWEMKGVPLRIEIGPRDVEGKKAVLVPRDLGARQGKSIVGSEGLAKEVHSALHAMQQRLREKAQHVIATHQKPAQGIAEAKAAEGIAVLPWCGAEACGLQVEQETEKAVLGVPVRVVRHGERAAIEEEPQPEGRCGACGKATRTAVRIARTY
jgi:prolyl-tRNA synthetase